MPPSLSYQDINLVPAYSAALSRRDIDVGASFLGRRYELPIIPANMSAVISPDIARHLSEHRYLYFMHRFGDTEAFVRQANSEAWREINISVGVKEEDRWLLATLATAQLRVDTICIDIAHGHSILMKDMLGFVHTVMPPATKIVAGNVATLWGVSDLRQWGADAVKVGIGGGRACSTRLKTAFHVPMFSCVQECCSHGRSDIPIIADGGIRTNGDIAKALCAGATMVMAGSLFAACTDAPGDSGSPGWGPKPTTKTYWGSASEHQKGGRRNVEGVKMQIPCNGMTFAEKTVEIREDLQSACSYAGGTLEGLKKCSWVTHVASQ
jgi:GMP reductase